MSGGVYIMENKDKNTDYQKVARVGEKSGNCRGYTQNHFFVWDLFSLFLTQWGFKSHMKKLPSCKKRIPTQNYNLT